MAGVLGKSISYLVIYACAFLMFNGGDNGGSTVLYYPVKGSTI